MRSYSLFTILLLCLAILLVDTFAFYWLQSITKLITSTFLINAIHITFWVFTIGLITSIMILKVRLDDIDPRRKTTAHIFIVWFNNIFIHSQNNFCNRYFGSIFFKLCVFRK